MRALARAPTCTHTHARAHPRAPTHTRAHPRAPTRARAHAPSDVAHQVANLREWWHEACAREYYQFAIDDDFCVDATLKVAERWGAAHAPRTPAVLLVLLVLTVLGQGGMARLMNHSCDPNCYTRVVTIARKCAPRCNAPCCPA